LAFVLPIFESLVNGAQKASRKTDYGRTPSVLVLLPTRELAKQVEFYKYLILKKRSTYTQVLTTPILISGARRF
jgi:superfamily II DNA/RNA helicase